MQSLVQSLSNGEADLAQAARFYVDVLGSLSDLPILTTTSAVAHVNGTINLPNAAVDMLLLFYGSTLQQLGELSIREANWLFDNWRVATGTQPYNFVRESYNQRQVNMVPVPSTGGSATILYTHTTDTLPTWLQLPVALLVLAMEYARESKHQHLALAAAFRALGTFTMKIALALPQAA